MTDVQIHVRPVYDGDHSTYFLAEDAGAPRVVSRRRDLRGRTRPMGSRGIRRGSGDLAVDTTRSCAGRARQYQTMRRLRTPARDQIPAVVVGPARAPVARPAGARTTRLAQI